MPNLTPTPPARPRKHLLPALLLVLSLLAASCANPAAPYLAEGDRLAGEGRTAEAVLAYRQAADRAPNDVDALTKLGRGYAAEGRRRLAARFLEAAAHLQPSYAALLEEAREMASPSSSTAEPVRLAWSYAGDGTPPTSLAREGDAIYAAFEGGTLVALDAASGQLRWSLPFGVKLTSPPAALGDRVVVGGADGVVRGVDAATGQLRWESRTAAPVYAAPALADGFAFAPSGDGSLYALNAETGALRWQVAAAPPLTSSPAVAGGVVYFGSADGRICAVVETSWRSLWGAGVAAQGPVESRPAVADGRVFVGAGDSRLYALAAETGGKYWDYSTADAIYAGPVIEGDTVYLASGGGSLTALDTLTGDVAWELQAETALPFSLALGRGAVYYVAAADPHLYAVDAATGEALWQVDTGDWLASGPIVRDGLLYVAGKDGTILAYRLPAR